MLGAMVGRIASATADVRVAVHEFASQRELRRLRREALAAPRFAPGEIELSGFRIRYPDLLSLYMEYKDIFLHRIYDFDCADPRPRVIDGGSYVGMSLLYTKMRHPGARVTCFEPDPGIRAMLEANIAANGLTDVDVVPKALGPQEGVHSFTPDGADGGRIVAGAGAFEIPTTPLSGYLAEDVDFLKLNIEAFELPVLRESRERLRAVKQMVVEYHGWSDHGQDLGEILTLLDAAGFRYLLNHFDYETNGAVRPPFRLDRDTRWFALLYARRDDLL